MPDFTANAFIYDRVLSGGGTDYKDANYGNTAQFRTENWNYTPWSDIKSFLKFHLWLDDFFELSQADLLIKGNYHWNSGTTNESELNKVTSSWNEDIIT